MTTTESHLGRALDELDASNRRLLAVCDLSVALGGSLDPAVIARRLARESARLLGSPQAAVTVELRGHRYAAGHPGAVPAAVQRALREHLTTRRDDPAATVDGGPLGLGAGPALVLPLTADGAEIGALGLAAPAGGFDATDLWLCITTAALGSQALQTASLHERRVEDGRRAAEYAVAAEVQRRLRPSGTTTVPGLELAVASRASLGVGGDLLDHRAHDGGLLLAVGDVAGKGASAAMVLTAAQLATRRLLDADPALTASRLLDLLSDELGPVLLDLGSLMTLAVVQVREDGVAEIANAGQSPVVLHRDGGSPRLLLPSRPPLGAPFGDTEPRVVRLGTGDRLVLATDGLHEHRPGGAAHELGVDAVLRAVAGASGTEPLVDDLLGLLDRPAADDITIAVIRRTESA